MSIIKYIILGLLLSSLFLMYGNRRWEIPILVVANRWINWILISLFVGYFAQRWGISDRPFVVLSGTVFLVWFLVESVLIWLKIRVLNFSSISFFPRYSVNDGQTPWPTQTKYIQLRKFLRLNGFKEIQSIKTSILGIISLYSPVYQDSTGKILLQLVFIPEKGGGGRMAVNYVLMSSTKEENRYITDNLALPMGGYIPKKWVKVRKPLCTSLKRLLGIHQKSLEESKENFVIWESTPLDIINHQQSVLEFYNIKNGFLNPTSLHETYGKLTSEGCYSLWKQLLFLKYLGYCVS
jgi:hypothetical protein